MANYKIDAAHSEITFKVKHLMITNVTGSFTSFEASLETNSDNDFSNAKVSFEADVNSINTKNEQRDGHLKGEDFFDVNNHPKLSFSSTSFSQKNEEEYEVIGNLTIKGVTKSINLSVTYLGSAVDPWVQSKIGFEINGKLNRKDFGLTWSATTEAGGLVVSDEVKLNLNVQLIKQ